MKPPTHCVVATDSRCARQIQIWFRRIWFRRIGRSSKWFVVALLLMTALGCVNRGQRPSLATRTLAPFADSGDTIMPDRWWHSFEDPDLDLVVNQALGENFSLAIALQRLRAARALTRREASDLFWDVDGVVRMDRTFASGPEQRNIVWGLDAAYQVDLWGQIQSRVDAERLRAEATHADYHAVALALSAEVARTWFSLVEAHAQLALLEQQIDANRRGLKAQELRFGRGFIRSPDLLRQGQLVESTLEQQVVTRARVEVLEHQLAVLLGQLPQTASYEPGAELPELPPIPYAGLPSELLARRPDVRRDCLAFQAADRDLASAITAQYPRINLSASVVNATERPEDLFRHWFASVGGQLIAPLLDGGQRRAEVDRTGAVLSQRFYEYGQTMLIAFREVEDSLARERYQIQRIERLNAQARLAKLAAEQLREQYFIREADFLDVLSAIQAQQRLQRETLSARLDLVLIRIGLYLALAGDFDTRPAGLASLPGDLRELPPPDQLPAQAKPERQTADLPTDDPTSDLIGDPTPDPDSVETPERLPSLEAELPLEVPEPAPVDFSPKIDLNE